MGAEVPSLARQGRPRWTQVIPRALGRERPAGVRTGLSFWFLSLNTEKTEKL